MIALHFSPQLLTALWILNNARRGKEIRVKMFINAAMRYQPVFYDSVLILRMSYSMNEIFTNVMLAHTKKFREMTKKKTTLSLRNFFDPGTLSTPDCLLSFRLSPYTF